MKPNLIGGHWVDSSHTRPNVNPSDISDRIDDHAQADAAQVRMAVEAAVHAFPAWATGSVQARADALERIASELLARSQELGTLLAREEGKTRAEGIAEVTRAGHIFRFHAGEVVRQIGERLPSVRAGVDVEVTREPVGVVGIITPWNFPMAIPAWKIAPALAWGNCVIFKPAELVPGSAWALAEIISRSGIPAGVFNLVCGPGRDVGPVLLNDPRVSAISFTGSTGTGRNVIQACASRGARSQVEMGGKNPMIVLDDADLAVAVDCAIQGAYFSTGQRCTATSRLIVTEGILGKFVKALTQRLTELRVGHALEAESHIGPVVNASQLEQDLDYVAKGISEGARLVFGGERLKRQTEGFYMSPALFVDAEPDMVIAREEIFGPVACVIAADNYDHALTLANDSEFGLSAGICTTSLKHATHFKRHMQAGMVMVNVPTAGVDYHVPFGGRKASNHGPREQGRHAAEFYTAWKTSYTAA